MVVSGGTRALGYVFSFPTCIAINLDVDLDEAETFVTSQSHCMLGCQAIAFFLVKLDWRSMDTEESDDEGEQRSRKAKDVSSYMVDLCGFHEYDKDYGW